MGQFRILIVEDEIIVRMVLSEMLSDLGCRVTEASTGREATEHLRNGAFDLLFSDVRLPGSLSGIDLAGLAREANPGISIIIASGATADLKERLAHLAPPPIIMPKPFDFPALTKLVQGMMQRV